MRPRGSGNCSGTAIDNPSGVPTHPRPRRPEGGRTHPTVDSSNKVGHGVRKPYQGVTPSSPPPHPNPPLASCCPRGERGPNQRPHTRISTQHRRGLLFRRENVRLALTLTLGLGVGALPALRS